MKLQSAIHFAIAMACGLAVQAHAANYKIYSPAHVHSSASLPVVVAAYNEYYGFDRDASDSLKLDNSNIGATAITVRRGAGALLIASPPLGATTLELPIAEGDTTWNTVEVQQNHPAAEHSGTLSPGVHTWDAATDHIITSDLVIPADAELTIEKGTLVRLYEHVNIIVRGTLHVDGSEIEPVAFLPETAGQPWGTIDFEQTKSFITHCFFSGGGGDTTKPFGHSGSQPVVYADHSTVHISNSFFVYNPGKAFGSSRSNITLDRVLISHCDTGGEFYSSVISINRSLIMDIPDGDGLVDDDDNDGFYFAGVKEDEATAYSTLYNTTISLTEDDCVDHNGARVRVVGCLLERAYHEGVAGSNGHVAIVENTLVQQCGQGIEAGYGSPLVIVDHCVVIDNGVGLRFGDSYDEPSVGSMRATNTIVAGNSDNILNFEPQLNASLPGALSVAYCMTNATEFNDSVGCITGVPLFDGDVLLAPDSPGYRAGIDGSSMGLYDENSASIAITEIFSESPEGGTSDWVEIHNPFPLPYDIGLWSIEQGDEVYTFPPGTSISAHGYIVLCRDSLAFRAKYSHEVHLLGGLPFDLGYSGTVALKLLTTTIDSVSYATTAPWPERAVGGSIVLIDPFLDNSKGGSWYTDPASDGTPGYYQPRTLTDIPEGAIAHTNISIAPQPFGNYSAISFTLPRTAQVELLVYNAVGIHIQTLLCEQRTAGTHTIAFDATSLPAGTLYIVLKVNGELIGFAGGIHIQND